MNVIGPRNRIDGVRLLGPLPSAPQVEVSRTDEFCSASTRPFGTRARRRAARTVHLKEGLICAKRHIHMTPEDGAAYGVVDGDEVEVAIAGGLRPLVFGDVLVRVRPKYKLEMHLDTDEANAAELNQGAEGQLAYTEVGATAVLEKKRV